MKLRNYYAIAAISLATITSSQAATVFFDDFFYVNENAFIAEGGWTTITGNAGSKAKSGIFHGNEAGLEYHYNVALDAGDAITMNATINRWSNGSPGVNGYAYTMEVLLWDGVNFGTITSVAGGVQQGLSANLEEVTYTAQAEDVGKLVIFRQGNTGPGMGAGGGWGETTSVTYNVTPIPEPSAAALLGLGGLALSLRRRK